MNERDDEIRKTDGFKAQKMKYKMRLDCETMKKSLSTESDLIMTKYVLCHYHDTVIALHDNSMSL